MALVHILERKTKEIVGTLNSNKAEYWEALRHDSLYAENNFDFIANATLEKSILLEKQNRLIIQDEDGFFREYIIYYSEQYKRGEKIVKSDASYVALRNAKIIDPQTLTGTTAPLAAEMCLAGTEWQPGEVEFTSTQTIVIDKRTNPLDFLKTIASTFELEISYRIVINANKVVGRYVDMKKQIAGFEGKEIVFGKDLISVRRKEDSSNIITALLGVYTKSDGTELTFWAEDEEALQRWGDNGKHQVDWYEIDSNDDEMTIEKLKILTQNELKKRIDAIVSYEGESASIEHVFGREHEKIRKGQTVRIKDDGYNPPLYLEARIQDVYVDQITGNIQGYKLGNFIEFKKKDLESKISSLEELMKKKVQELEQNVVYKIEIISSNGLMFRLGSIGTTLAARVYRGGTEVTDTIDANYFKWTRQSNFPEADKAWNDTWAGGRKSITVTNEDVNHRATFSCEVNIP
jgi:phage minor structural protein